MIDVCPKSRLWGVWVEARARPLLTVTWGTVAVLLFVAAGVAYAQGRPAASLHQDSVSASRATSPAPQATAGTAGPQTGATTGESPTPRPSTGPGIDAPGTTISARVASPTSLDVSESVLLTTATTSVIITPPAVAEASADLASLKPSLTGVQVTAGGQVVPVLEDRITKALSLDLPAAATTIEVRYMLEGGVARTLPSKAGRALAGLRPVVTLSDSPVAYVFGGEEIIGVSCPDLGSTSYACVAGQPGRLAVAKSLPRAQSVVLLQINLPRP